MQKPKPCQGIRPQSVRENPSSLPNMQSARSFATLQTTFVREVSIATGFGVVGALMW